MLQKLLVLLISCGTVVGAGCSEPEPVMDDVELIPTAENSTPDRRSQFVGNWELVRRERITSEDAGADETRQNLHHPVPTVKSGSLCTTQLAIWGS